MVEPRGVDSSDENNFHDDQDDEWVPVESNDVVKYVNNKKTLYEACVRNDYLVPPYRDAIVTFKFLEMV